MIDHVQVHACNELIIKSVDFLLKIFDIVITFERGHMYIQQKLSGNHYKK